VVDLGNLARDISAGEKVEAEIDAMIRRRGDQRRETEGERPAEEAWMESERRYNAQRERDRRAAWAITASRP
jgi:hypothetical protein